MSPDRFTYFLTLHSVYHHFTISPKSSSPNRAITLTTVYVIKSPIYKLGVIKLIRNITTERKEEVLVRLLFKYQNVMQKTIGKDVVHYGDLQLDKRNTKPFTNAVHKHF